MCLIVFAYKTSSDYPFILAGNRDEFFERPTLPAHKWKTKPAIFAGKDKKAGGTWLGFTETGRFAALTNFRDMNNLKEDAPSRGDIATSFLLNNNSVETSLKELKKRSKLYNGFNLIAGTFDKLYYLSNYRDEIEEIMPGIHAISNAYLNTPWPKTVKAKEEFENVITANHFREQNLFEILKNSTTYPIEMLPETGLSEDMEQAVSSAFIQTENYGTRSTSIVRVDSNQNAELIENTYKPGTKTVTNREKLSCKYIVSSF